MVEPHNRVRNVSGCSQEHDEHGNAERTSDLAGGLVDCAADGESVGRQGRDGGGAEHREGQADAEADDQCPGQPVRKIRGGGVHSEHVPCEAAREANGAGHEDGPEADPAGEPPGGPGHNRHHERSWCDGEAGSHDRVLPYAGEEQDVAEQHGEETRREDEHGDIGRDERTVSEQGRIDHRFGMMS